MSQEGDKEASLPVEDVATISLRSGKRSRDNKDGKNLLSTAEECVKARDFDLSKKSATAGDDGNGREDQATENLNISQLGKRIKCVPDNSQHENDAENMSTSKKGENVSEDLVAANAFKKAQALTSEDEGGNQFYCTACSVKCTSVKDYGTHVAGKRHARAVMGVATPHSDKVTKKPPAGPKAKVSPPKTAALHEDASMKEQALSDGTGCTDMEVAVLQAFQSPILNDGKDVSVEQQQVTKEGAVMQALGSQVMKDDSTNKIALRDNGNGKLCEPLSNGNSLKALADGLAKCGNNMEGHYKKSIMDFARCKSNSECIARALAAAYQVCPCPGFESLLKSDTHDQAAGSMDAASANATDGMVSMHTQCFMNLLHDVQVKVMEDLFLHVVRDEKVRGFSADAWLTNGAPVSPLPPCAEDLNCTVCRVEYGSKSDLDRHVTGKKHTSLVTRLHARCHVCNVNCNSEKEFKKHVSGKKHGSKLRLAQKRGSFLKSEG